MLSYMLPVEGKPSSVTAAAARNLNLNLTTTTTADAPASGSGGAPPSNSQPASSSSSFTTCPGLLASRESSSEAAATVSGVPVAGTRSIIKPAIKHSSSHRYQLISSVKAAPNVGVAAKKRLGKTREQQLGPELISSDNGVAVDLCDESTNLLATDEREETEDDDDDEEKQDRDNRAGTKCSSLAKSDKNFNNLILVANSGVPKGGTPSSIAGVQNPQVGNCSHVGSVKLASVLKHSNSGGNDGGGASSRNSDGGCFIGYSTVCGKNDDDHHRLLVNANNLRNSGAGLDQPQQQQRCRNGQQSHGSVQATEERGLVGATAAIASGEVPVSNNSNSSCINRAMNSLNGNVPSRRVGEGTEVMELGDGGGGSRSGCDGSIDSDSDSVTEGSGGQDGATGTTSGGTGGKMVKLNKLGGNKNVTLKRVSFGSSKGSMVETLVFETPTPLPEHAEREFFQSPAVQSGAGHTTVYSFGGPYAAGTASGLMHHHYPSVGGHPLHHPHHHHHHVASQQPYFPSGYHAPDGAPGTRHHDDTGIEHQKEVERSKVRVTFFQSSKPQSISPPESQHLYGVQNLIEFGGSGFSVSSYDNNNSLLDTYITSTALNQHYEALSGHQQQQHQIQEYENFNSDPQDLTMTAVYSATVMQAAGYNRQISTESGWDNPFRPGGDLSREADEIVNLIKGGKPITPTGEQSLVNGGTPNDSHNADDPGATVVDGATTKLESSQLQVSQKNGKQSPYKAVSGRTESPGPVTSILTAPGSDGRAGVANNTNTTPISNQVIPGPQSASHVVIDEKKKKKCTCCVIQ